MTEKLELKSCYGVIGTVDVANIESIFHDKSIGPDILTVVMKDGKRLYCDEICPIDSLQEEPITEDLNEAATKYAQDKYMPVQTAEAFRAGYNKCWQEMMNSAIEREVKEDAGGYPYIDATELYDYNNDKPLAKAGDKVKVLIVKDK